MKDNHPVLRAALAFVLAFSMTPMGGFSIAIAEDDSPELSGDVAALVMQDSDDAGSIVSGDDVEGARDASSAEQSAGDTDAVTQSGGGSEREADGEARNAGDAAFADAADDIVGNDAADDGSDADVAVDGGTQGIEADVVAAGDDNDVADDTGMAGTLADADPVEAGGTDTAGTAEPDGPGAGTDATGTPIVTDIEATSTGTAGTEEPSQDDASTDKPAAAADDDSVSSGEAGTELDPVAAAEADAAADADGAAPLQASARQASVPVTFTLVDLATGQTLTQAQVGSGVTIYYYEILQSATASFAPGPGTTPADFEAFFKPYEKTFTLTSPVTTSMQLNMEQEATSDDHIFLLASTVRPYDYSASTDWQGVFMVEYDGTSVVNSTNFTLEADGAYHVTITKDNTPKVQPTFTFSAATEDADAFPFYLKATLHSYGNGMGQVEQSATVAVTGNGTYTVTFPTGVSASAEGHHSLEFERYSDEACTQVAAEWYETNLVEPKYYYSDDYNYELSNLSIDSNGTALLLYDGATLNLAFAHKGGYVQPTVKIVVQDPGESQYTWAFPVYLNLGVDGEWDPETHRHGYAGTYFRVDAPGEYTVTFPDKIKPSDSEDDYRSFSLGFYTRENREGYTRQWYTDTPNVTTTYVNGGFMVAENGAVCRDGEELVVNCIYDPDYDEPWVQVNIQSTEGELSYPTYMKVTLYYWEPHYGYNGDQLSRTVWYEITENGHYQIYWDDVVHMYSTQDMIDTSNWPYYDPLDPRFINSGLTPDIVFSTSKYRAYIEYGLYDSMPSYNTPSPQLDTRWNYSGTTYVYPAYNDASLMYAEGLISAFCVLTPRISYVDGIHVAFSANLAEDAAEADFFPAYLVATLTSDSEEGDIPTPITVTRQLNGPGDCTEDLVFSTPEDGTKFPAGANATLEWKVYTDDTLSSLHPKWANGSASVVVTKNNTLQDNSLGTFALRFNPLTVPVKTEVCNPNDTTFPVVVEVTAEDYYDHNLSTRVTLENADATATADFGILAAGWSYWGISHEAKVGATADDPRPDWQAKDWGEQWCTQSMLGELTLNFGDASAEAYEAIQVWGGVFVDVNVHTIVPDGADEAFYYRPGSYGTRYPKNLTIELYARTVEYGNIITQLAASQIVHLDAPGDSVVSFEEPVPPGVYYLTWYTNNTNYYYTHRDEHWNQGDAVKIIVNDDGSVTDADGNAFVLQNIYMGWVHPQVNVDVLHAVGIESFTMTARTTFTGVTGTDTEGRSQQYYRTYSADGIYDVAASYSSSSWLPPGEYDVEWAGWEGSYWWDRYSSSWPHGTDRVTINSDGTITKDGQPYVIPMHQLAPFDQVTVQVNTTVHEGVTTAFTPGDTFKVVLYDRHNENGQVVYDIIAEGTAVITEAGESVVTLTPLPGKYIYAGTSAGVNSSSYYCLSYATYGEDGEANLNWRCRLTEQRYRAELDVAIGEDAVIYQRNNTALGDPLVLDNESMIKVRPVNGVAPEVTQPEEGITFKPITSLTQLQDKGHYMIVTYNVYDGKWYALSWLENGDTQVQLVDVESVQDLIDGYVVAESDLNSTGYIFTANKVSQSESATSLQLKLGIKNENNKAWAIKMGTNSSNVQPLFDVSAGTLIISSLGGDNPNAPLFQVWKNTYAQLSYISEWFGQHGFNVEQYKKGYYQNMATVQPLYWPDKEDKHYYRESYSNYSGGYTYTEGFLASKPMYIPDSSWSLQGLIETYTLEMDPYYITDEYTVPFLAKYAEITGSSYGWYYRSNMTNFGFYILSDVNPDEEQATNNEYVLVRTFGDFVNTFITNANTPPKSLVLVYTDDEGKDWALQPKQLTQVVTKAASGGSKTLTAGSDNELIVNNNSRDSQGQTTFNFAMVDIQGTGEQMIVTGYAMRKSRVNNMEGKEYLTLSDGAWSAADDAVHDENLIYVLHPTTSVYSKSEWGTRNSYKLSVIRDGVTMWLGVEDGQMVAVADEASAVVFDIYAPTVERFYPMVATTDYAPFYRITSLDDINSGDELLIVYNDGTKREIVANTPAETPYYMSNGSAYSYWSGATPPLLVSDRALTIDTWSGDFPDDMRYRYRLDTDDHIKKAFAYMGSDTVIMAQGVAVNVPGDTKSIKKDQRKFASVIGIGMSGGRMWIKTSGSSQLYTSASSEVSFIPDGNGNFYLRGGKTDAWLGVGSYQTALLNLSNGKVVLADPVDTFVTVGTDDRVAFEIYKLGGEETITVNYHELDGSILESSEKPEGLISLKQDIDDITDGGNPYIFVGWTKDESKAGLLSLDESANIFDFDDLSRVAAVKESVRETYGLLGDCNPATTNSIVVMKADLEDTDGVLDLYPVFARRGFTSAVTANDGDVPIIGIVDSKDVQGGGDGQIEARERWLGSIDIEVYKDGELWVPAKAQTEDPSGVKPNAASPLSIPGRMVLAAEAPALKAGGADGTTTATMYFAYHNDDAADLNIKFIADGVEDLLEYLRSNEFTAAEPTEQYVIDAVFAYQGGSEDGLRFRYNWLDEVYGGQLDNVKGGSTVRVYVTTKYQVKFYFDDGEADGYQLLPFGDNEDEFYTDPNYYTTPGTEEAVKAARAEADYYVLDQDGDPLRSLIARDINDPDRFSDDAIRRGEYSAFLYKFDDNGHEFPVVALPVPPEGSELDSDVWTLRNEALEELGTNAPDTTYAITGTTYGTGNTVNAYKGADDAARTYHFYISVVKDTTSVKVTKVWNDADDQYGLRPESITVQLAADGEAVEGKTLQLSEENDWTGTFSGLAVTLYGQEVVYGVEELEVDGYEVTIEDDGKGGFTITNTVIPPTGSLRITKVLPTYETSGTSFVFDVVATKNVDGDVKMVYSNVAMISFDAPGTQSAVLENIPAGAKVTVTEIYTGTVYVLDSAASQEQVIEAQKTVEVTFKNNYEPDNVSGHGVVNMFDNDGNGGWNWKKAASNPDVMVPSELAAKEGDEQ